jgi:surface protein
MPSILFSHFRKSHFKMKTFVQSLGSLFILLFFTWGVNAQIITPGNFEIKYTFSTAVSEVSFDALTSGNVNYSYAISGGTPVAGTAPINNPSIAAESLPISVPAGGTLVISFEPANLKRFKAITSSGTSSAPQLTDVLQWGTATWSSMANMFDGCTGLTISAMDAPKLPADLSYMFRSCSKLENVPGLNAWDVRGVSTMVWMFGNTTLFNQDITGWFSTASTVSSVNMSSMFSGAKVFNQPIGVWNVSKVTDMSYMFDGASKFNQYIGGWDVSKVVKMHYMFRTATDFNQDISGWIVSNVDNMSFMFNVAKAFNANISGWDVSKVANMSQMFRDADAFNQPIGLWGTKTGNVTDMSYMFQGAAKFDQNISGWDVRKVTKMDYMFDGRPSGATYHSSNTPASLATALGSTVFNQNIGAWILNPAVTMVEMLSYCGMSCENYSKTLMGWANNNSGAITAGTHVLGALNLKYSSEPAVTTKRDVLTNTLKWNIAGDAAPTDCGIMPALPVTFGNISAIIKNEQLQISFSTLSETNVDRFEIEVSKDGNNFVKIGEVKTKAENGNSTAELNYSFSKEVAGVSGLLGFSLLVLAIGFANRKKRSLLPIAYGLLFIAFFAACKKTENPVQNSKEERIFIRIKQMDINGDFQYSKVVQVIKN